MKRFIGSIIGISLLGSVCFAEFSDVSPTHWAYYSINKMQTEGILSGYSDGTFKPGNNITLAEFAAIFTKIFEIEKDNNSNYFPDVPVNHWGKANIEAIREYINPYYDSVGEALGYDKYSYLTGLPGDIEMTREAFVYAIAKIYGYDEREYVEGEEKTLFEDYEDIIYPKETVLVYKNGLISGEVIGGKTYMRPARFISRAEASAIFTKMLKYEAKQVTNNYEEYQLKEAFEKLIAGLKNSDFNEIKKCIYDTANVLNNKNFKLGNKTEKVLKSAVNTFFDDFEYEVTDKGFYSFNRGYVRVNIKSLDVKTLFEEMSGDLLEAQNEADIDVILNDFAAKFEMMNNDENNKAVEHVEIINFAKQDGKWKLNMAKGETK